MTAASALRPVARDFAFLAGSQALLKVAALLFGVFVVRSLGAAEFGRYAAALAFAGLFALATGPGAQSFGTREMARDPASIARLVPDIAALRFVLAIVIVPLLALAAWALGRAPEAVVAVAVAGLGLPLHALTATFDSALVARGEVRRAAAWATLRQALFVAFGTAALLLGGGSVALLAAGHAAVLARALLALGSVRRLSGVRLARPAPRGWPALLRRLWPFSLEGVSDQAGLHAPIALLALVADEAATGQYAAAFALVLAAQPFAQSLGTALTPRLSAPAGRELLPRATGTAVRTALLAGFPVALLVGALAERLLAWAYGAAFAPAAPALRVLVWALPLMFAGEALRAALLALQHERALARAAVLGTLAALGLTPLLAATWGGTGAAGAFLALRAIVFSVSAIALVRALPAAEARQALGLTRA